MVQRIKLKYKSDLFLPGSSDDLIGYVLGEAITTALQVDGVDNAEPSEEPNTTIPIRVEGTKKFGVTARHLVIARVIGTPPNRTRIYRKVPVLDPDVWRVFISALAPEISFGGASDWILIGGIGERRHLLYGSAGV